MTRKSSIAGYTNKNEPWVSKLWDDVDEILDKNDWIYKEVAKAIIRRLPPKRAADIFFNWESYRYPNKKSKLDSWALEACLKSILEESLKDRILDEVGKMLSTHEEVEELLER